MIDVERSDVIAFRLWAHNLVERRRAAEVEKVLGACGIQNSPPGSALLALNARLEGLTSDFVDGLVEDKVVVQTWSMRGAPYYVPTADASIFTTGVLPPTESARMHLIRGVEPALRDLDLALDETVALISDAVRAVLRGRQLAIDELGHEVAERVGVGLPPRTRDIWNLDGPYAADQSLGEAIVHFCLRILTLRGIVCFARRSANKAPFVLVDEWFEQPWATIEHPRAELVRRYLHCYGPSTRPDFASWLGVYTGDVDAWWDAIENELSPVSVDGRPAWMLGKDITSLGQSIEPVGVRLLPPGDPFTQLRDRAILVDQHLWREVWKNVGSPGTVLADGRLIGTWRGRKSGRKFSVTVHTFADLKPRHAERLRHEAEQLSRLRGAAALELEING